MRRRRRRENKNEEEEEEEEEGNVVKKKDSLLSLTILIDFFQIADPTSTPHRPYIDPTSTLHRPHIDPRSTPHRPHSGKNHYRNPVQTQETVYCELSRSQRNEASFEAKAKRLTKKYKTKRKKQRKSNSWLRGHRRIV